jgi:hypothetical protein
MSTIESIVVDELISSIEQRLVLTLICLLQGQQEEQIHATKNTVSTSSPAGIINPAAIY